MSRINEIQVPTTPKPVAKKDRDYPISPRENLLRALNHEKPLWMPNFNASSQTSPAGANIDQGNPVPGDFVDWFGVQFKYLEDQKMATPVGKIMDSVVEWKEKVVFPDLDKLDWMAGFDTFERDESCAITNMFGFGIFERLHVLEGFENALVDLISEPEFCREFFDAAAKFRVDVFDRLNEIYHYDYVIFGDDWGTARGPFFSVDLFKKTILPAAIRAVRRIQDSGVKVVFHNCGLVNDFIPYLVDDIGSDGLQIQTINDIKGIIKKYGARCTVEYCRPDPFLLYDPETTVAQVKELGRWMVDTFGAHVNPGAGATYSISAPNEDVYYTLDDEIYNYSLEKYRSLS